MTVAVPFNAPAFHSPEILSPVAERKLPVPVNCPLDWLPSYFEPSAQVAETCPGNSAPLPNVPVMVSRRRPAFRNDSEPWPLTKPPTHVPCHRMLSPGS